VLKGTGACKQGLARLPGERGENEDTGPQGETGPTGPQGVEE
jgi:hypothetical protein